MKKLYFSALVAALIALSGIDAVAQSTAQIHIRRNQDGVISEETREVQLKEGQDIDEILRELGVLDEFGQLKEGQELEIRIDKSNGDQEIQNLHLFFSPPNAPDAPDAPRMFEFAPIPEMESRPFLGVMLKENVEEKNGEVIRSGAIISEVIEGTAALEAGLEVGDQIVEIDGQEMSGSGDVIDYIQSKNIGDKVSIKVIRDGKKKTVKATLGEKEMESTFYREIPEMQRRELFGPDYNFRFSPDSITIFCPQSPICRDSMKICQPFTWNGEGMAIRETAFLGVTPVENAEGSTPAGEGVKINVEEGTSAEEMGLVDGDLILEFNSVKVNSFDALADEIGKANPGDDVKIIVSREGRNKELTGPIGKRNISGFEDFRIFHDYKGMDEGGNYFYDYEFDMDEEDVQEQMENLLQELDRQQEMLEDERSRIEEELERLRETETIEIRIQIADISPEEAEVVNKNATPKLEQKNDLAIDQISFYPNPNDGVLNLTFQTREKNPVKVIIYNAEGNTVYLEERSGFDGKYQNTIDISDEPNGTYYLQILQNGKSYSKKIVKGL